MRLTSGLRLTYALFLTTTSIVATTRFADARPTPPSEAAFPVAPSTVMPVSEGPALLAPARRTLLGPGKVTFWKPRPEQLPALEASLPKNLTYYYRQYIGMSQGHRRLILVNGFNAGVASAFIGGKTDWHRHAVAVKHGGTAFFHGLYDPHTRQFVGPFYNGEN